MPKASMRDVRRVNRALLMRHLILTRATSRGGVSSETGLSAATVTNVITELLDEGTVIELGQLESDGGRRRTVLAINPDAAVVFGADVSESTVTVEAFDLSLKRLGQRQLEFSHRRIDPAEVTAFIEQAVDGLLRETDGSDVKVLGLGLGVPGLVENPLDGDASNSLLHAEVVGWGEVSFGALADRLGFPVLIDNGSKTTTQAEAWFGSARGAEHAIVVLIGDGAGAGVITNGRLYRGSSSSAGEWGHTKISLDGAVCRCGSRGCVETVIGASAVLAQWKPYDPDTSSGEAAGIAALFHAAEAGEPSARRVVADLIDHLGLALSNLVNLYNPQKIIVGGWFGDRIAAEYLEQLAVATRRYSLKQPGNEAVLERSQLGQDAAPLGAATLALDRFIESGWPR